MKLIFVTAVGILFVFIGCKFWMLHRWKPKLLALLWIGAGILFLLPGAIAIGLVSEI